ncbi:MAG: Asp-tRNA(Asn)/Glu-tRNA(Gln) amidotransferase subunit GatC [Betaproteobacteria bacterium]|jgi:aspartyl-tRNA(Asn)/glutamyl-tRNA(Gln) amidotransferase subunit C|nr:MAG: Asp-tRNA(Asn)/Glu-tRNA(Gln) amidotransferase subunit GatC [Betaproteobacteria bacterium]
MSLTLADVQRIAHLARIEITDEQARAAQAQLNDIFAMIEQISRVDATGVAPMTHPLDGAQRLREDVVEPPPDRDELLRNAPAQQQGLFLVPRVIE